MFGHLWETSVTTVNQLEDSDTFALRRAVARTGRRAGALALIVGLAACSTAPDWAKPGLIYGDDAAAASADPSSDRDFPELADVPPKPTPPSTAAERREAAEGLAADRERARYTDEILRGGTEAPAQAPRSAAPAPAPVVATPTIAPAPVAAASDPAAGVIPEPARGGRALPSTSATSTADVPQNRAAETEAVEVVRTPAPAPAAQAPAAQPAAQAAAPAATTPTQAAAPVTSSYVPPKPAAAQPTRRAAVPPLPAAERAARAQRAAEASRSMVDDRMGTINAASAAVQSTVAPTAAAVTQGGTRANDRFEASTAPVLAQEALDAAGPVVSSRYGTPASASVGSADPEDPVEVNLDALRGIGPGASLQPANGPGVTAAYGNQGGPGNIPPYVVNFGHGSVHLTTADRQKIAAAADVALTHGNLVRVVGHASSRTGDVSVGRHVLANFKASLDRATAVADELIRNGVDPSRVLVEAKGDTVPVYYESMPAGEAGNRRAEIFIE